MSLLIRQHVAEIRKFSNSQDCYRSNRSAFLAQIEFTA